MSGKTFVTLKLAKLEAGSKNYNSFKYNFFEIYRSGQMKMITKKEEFIYINYRETETTDLLQFFLYFLRQYFVASPVLYIRHI